MNNTSTQQTKRHEFPSSKPVPKRDCISSIVFIALFGWIAVTSYIRQSTILTASIDPTPDLKWTALAGALIHIVLLGLPLSLLAFFWPRPRYKAVFQTWILATGLILLLLPAYLPDLIATQLQAVLQIFFTTVFCALILLLARFRTKKTNFMSPSVGNSPDSTPQAEKYSLTALWFIILLVAALMAYPWLARGALGSFLDTFLQLVFGLVFGLAASLLIEFFLLQPLRQYTSSIWQDYILGGLSIGIVLIILVSATVFSFGGMQLLLMLVLPGLGFVIMPLTLFTQRAYKPPKLNMRVSATTLPYTFLIGLVAAFPLALIDPDELAYIVSASAGEILGLAFQAAFTSMFTILAITFLLFIIMLWRRSRQDVGAFLSTLPRWASALLGGAALAAWLGAMVIYITTGQPGFYGERLFVIFESQADLSAATNIDDYHQRRQYVYDSLVKHANTHQQSIRQVLERFNLQYTPYYLVNAIEVEGNPLLHFWLLTRPEVDRILDSPRMRPLPASRPISTGYESAPTRPQWNLTQIRADRVWESLGVTGEGIIIGQSDSGVQSDHPELINTYRGKDGNHDYNWFDPWNGTAEPTDIEGHGTHTLGSIVGQKTGVAPGATWYACVNLARNLGNPALYLDCMQFMLAPFPANGDPLKDGDPTRGAHVINNSWGCPEIEGCDANSLLYAVRALRTAGVFVVASGGNDGPACNTLNTPPPIYAEVISVGAIDQFGNLASFSSIGPVTVDGSQRVKPDIIAPGVGILSSMPGNTYGSSSGTSMAGPHVVGVVALMWSANPALIGDIDRTEQILIRTTQPYNGRLPDCPGVDEVPSTAVGYGLVDAYAAVQMALQEASR